jgi:predicted alpha-1,6-mannanase (GH76 family)
MSIGELGDWLNWTLRHRLPGIGLDEAGSDGLRQCAAAGTHALQRWYEPRTGMWGDAGWWRSASALTTIIQYMQRTGDHSHADVIATTFSAASRTHPDFIDEFYDDNGWWALAWIAAFDLTGDQKYLDAATTIFDQMTKGWDSTCRGGLWWSTAKNYKNAIPNELFLLVAARLHQRANSGDDTYLTWALKEWEWFKASGLIGSAGLVNDGLTPECANNGGPTWTYNQGVILAGLAALDEITGDHDDYLKPGDAIAEATLRHLTTGQAPGILAESCELSDKGCDGDQLVFKGIFIRHLYDFYLRSPRSEYRAFIFANAHSIWQNNRDWRNRFGLRWAGPIDQADASRQSSALDVLNAAVALTGAEQVKPVVQSS